MTPYATGVLVVVGMAVAWAGVQSAWRRSFPRRGADPDALAGRLGCHGCDAADECDHECDSDGLKENER